MAVTYQNFLDAMNKYGLSGQFSSYDLDLAKKNPSAGLSLVTIKNNYKNATTDEQKAMYNQMANDIRQQYGGYVGGTSGSDYIAVGGPSPDDFVYDVAAPTWESPYADQIESILGQINGFKDFSYDVESDPLYSQYRKQYLREGQRATADTLGQMAAANGGQVSTAASSAASQAGDYYASQLSDKVPELEQYAYGKWQDEYNQLLTELQLAQSREDSAYQKYLAEYDRWNNDRQNAYNQYLSELDWQSNKELQEYEKELLAQQNQTTTRDEARAQVDAILQAGGTISDALLEQAQYDPSYITALQEYYRQQAIQALQSSSSGGGGGGNGSDESEESTSGIVDTMIGIGNDTRAYEYLISLGYSNDITNKLWEMYQEEQKNVSTTSGSDGGMNVSYYNAFVNSILAQLRSGKFEAAENNINSRWGELSPQQQEGLKNYLKQYGIEMEGM